MIRPWAAGREARALEASVPALGRNRVDGVAGGGPSPTSAGASGEPKRGAEPRARLRDLLCTLILHPYFIAHAGARVGASTETQAGRGAGRLRHSCLTKA